MSIRKRSSKKAKNGYVYEVYFNYTNACGVPSRYSKSGFTTKKQAQDHETEKKQELLEHGTIKKEVKLTLNEVFDEVVKNEFPYTLQENSIITYKSSYNKHVRDSLGNYEIRSIKYSDLLTLFNSKENYAKKTVAHIRDCMNIIFRYAMKCEYVESNPISLITLSGIQPEEKEKIYSDDEFNIIINDLLTSEHYHYHSFAIALYIGKYTAMRISEVFALDWNDIDFMNNTININKKMVYLDSANVHSINKLKNSASKAIIPLASPLKQILLEWKKENESNHIICSLDGEYLNPGRLSNTLTNLSKKHGFRFTFHMLRHTYATQLYNDKVDIKTVQALLRHSSVNTTLDIYTHTNIGTLSSTVDSIFNSESVEKVSKIKNQLN